MTPAGFPNRQTRFSPPEATPITRERAREMADRVNDSAQLAAFVADCCITIETLWTEVERALDGLDRNMEIVAQQRGDLGRAGARIRELESRLGSRASTIEPEVIERLRSSLEFGRQRKYVAESIDLHDLDAILTFIDAMGTPQ